MVWVGGCLWVWAGYDMLCLWLFIVVCYGLIVVFSCLYGLVLVFLRFAVCVCGLCSLG